jgi:hypothetical protein
MRSARLRILSRPGARPVHGRHSERRAGSSVRAKGPRPPVAAGLRCLDVLLFEPRSSRLKMADLMPSREPDIDKTPQNIGKTRVRQCQRPMEALWQCLGWRRVVQPRPRRGRGAQMRHGSTREFRGHTSGKLTPQAVQSPRFRPGVAMKTPANHKIAHDFRPVASSNKVGGPAWLSTV